METVRNCNYSEKVGLVEKILVLISILEILPNVCYAPQKKNRSNIFLEANAKKI
jgi:hypothetical protein